MPSIASLLHDPGQRLRWRWLLIVLVLLSAYFAFTPHGPEEPAPLFEGLDKVQHLLAFGSIALAAALSQAAGWRQFGLAAAGGLSWGVVIEIVQTQVPGRSADPADVLADAGGIACGLLLALVARRIWPTQA